MNSVLNELHSNPTSLPAMTRANEMFSLMTDPSVLFSSYKGNTNMLSFILKTLDSCISCNEDRPEFLVVAIRCLVNLLSIGGDGGNVARSIISHEHLFRQLCNHLVNIQFIDLAELVFLVLDKVSAHCPAQLWSFGGLDLLLGFIDFFPIGTQRVAMSAIANICRSVPKDFRSAAKAKFPDLCRMVNANMDDKMLERICQALSRLTINFSKEADFANLLSESGLVPKLVVVVSEYSSGDSFIAIIKTFHCIVRSCPNAIVDIIVDHDVLINLLSRITEDSGHCKLILSLLVDIYPSNIVKDSLVHSEFLWDSYNSSSVNVLLNLFQTVTGVQMVSQSALDTPKANEDLVMQVFSSNRQLFDSFSSRLLPILFGLTLTDPMVVFLIVMLLTRMRIKSNREMVLFVVNLIHSTNLFVLVGLLDFLQSNQHALDLFMREGLEEEMYHLIRDLNASSARFNNISLSADAPKMEEALDTDLDAFKKSHPKFSNNLNGDKEKQRDRLTEKFLIWLKFKSCIFYENSFGELPKSDNGVSQANDKVQLLAKRSNELSFLNSDKVSAALKDINSCLSDASCYEIKRSGLIEELIKFIKGQHGHLTYQERWEMFVKIMSLESLVKSLHEFIDRYGRYPILKIEGSNLRYLATPLKVKLQKRNCDEGGLVLVINVEPLATLRHIDKFLAHQVSSFADTESNDSDSLDCNEEAAGNWKSLGGSRFNFYFDNQHVEPEMNFLQIAFRSSKSFESVLKLWSKSMLIEYEECGEQMEGVQYGSLSASHSSNVIVKPTHQSHILSLMETGGESNHALDLLKAIYALYDHYGCGRQYSLEMFHNKKLCAKITHQINDPFMICSRKFPDWMVSILSNYSFMFPLDLKLSFFTRVKLDVPRALHNILHASKNEKIPIRIARIKRLKFKVDRASSVESMFKILDHYGSSRKVIEIQYRDEVGTGLGPTLEFYSLACSGLKDMNNLWLPACKLLYPLPLGPRETYSNLGQNSLRAFKMMGALVARALYDSRPLDLPLHPIFIMQVIGREFEYSLSTLGQVDAVLAKSLADIQRMDCETIDLLGLTFILPGYPEMELHANGANHMVSGHNVKDYVEQVVEWFLCQGIKKQICAFRDGFRSVLSLNNLSIFSATEIQSRLQGSHEEWSLSMLQECVITDHGYNLDSGVIKLFFQYMIGLDEDKRRSFLAFLTGSPILLGGLKKLDPKLTIVRKVPDTESVSPDSLLPSVMTCVNYLKLPNYSSMEILTSKMDLAIKEGSGSFHLS